MPEQERKVEQLSRSEMVTALSHYYRAESARSLAWRERLDRTTNWGVGSTAAFLGFGFSHPEIPHSFFLFGLAVVYILLFVESRRYRFYDAYEYRVRLLHHNLFYGILAEGRIDLEGETFWREELAADLRYPQYKMGLRYALGRRLYANYIYLFAVLVAGWLLKIKLHPRPVASWDAFLAQAAIGALPGELTLGFLVLFAGHLALLVRIGRRSGGARDLLHRSR